MTAERFRDDLQPTAYIELREGLIDLWVNVSRAGGAFNLQIEHEISLGTAERFMRTLKE